ncbi:dienelactone hydrolase family protein [Qipengyuania nanhaisediminis]|uniref:dienelactone hydrolase family protein n=1 Tax=Qipengyuania nanhaisediminis TaxID=604088 RepID=UPI0038B2E395
MCEDQKLKEWAGQVSRRDFTVLTAGAAVAACSPGDIAQGEVKDQSRDGGFSDLAQGDVVIETRAGAMDAFFVHPAQGAFPGVIFWPDIAGLREAKRNMARRLARHGFSVLVVNPYYRDVSGERFADFAAFIDADGFARVSSWRDRLTADAIGSDARMAAGWLDSQASVDTDRALGTQGYCMGGPFAVWSAAALPDRIGAAASFHGGGLVREDDPLSPHRTLDRAEAAFLIAVARDDDDKDPVAKRRFAEAAEQAGRQAVVRVYEGDHGWTVPDSPAYVVPPAEQAFGDLLALYEANL